MLLITRLISKEWFKAFLSIFIVLFLIASAGDIVNGFMRGRDTERVFFEYLLKSPLLLRKILPISCLLGTVFSISKLKSSNELISILASGYHPRSIYFIVLATTSLVSIFHFLNISYLEPYATKLKRKHSDEHENRRKSKIISSSSVEGGKIWYKSQNYFVSFDLFKEKTNTLINPSFYFYDLESYLLSQILSAKKAIFNNKKNYWHLYDVKIIDKVDAKKFSYTKSVPEKDLFIDERPSYFSELQSDLTTLKLPSLYHFVSKLDASGINSNEYKILVYKKISAIFYCIIFGLFPLYAVFSPNRRSSSMGGSIVFVLLFSVAFWVSSGALSSLGSSGVLNPFLSTFIVPALVAFFILLFYLKSQKL